MSVDEIQRSVECNRIHPATAPVIDWVEAPQNIEEFDKGGVSVYTDGSRTDQGVGSGVAIYDHVVLVAESSFGLPPYATVFQVELIAILKGLELCGSLHEIFSVLSDSMSSLMALSDQNCKDPLVAEIHESRKGLEVDWYWLKAHVGVQGNEAAGLLAKAGTELNVVNAHVDLSPSSVKPFLA